MTTVVLLLIALAVVGAVVAFRLGHARALRDLRTTPTSAPLDLPPAPAEMARPKPQRTSRPSASTPASQHVPAAQRPAVTSWGYQLQKLNIAEAAACPFDLLVVDAAKDGDDESALTPAEVRRLQTKPDGSHRLVLAYLSIGEAESYRGYWQPDWKRHKPEWLLGENPDWKENYAVRFWHPDWQAIMFGNRESRLDRILAAGFDGVYLDKCDVYEDMRSRRMPAAKERPDLESDMATFVRLLSHHAKSVRPGFMVVMQNAEGLLERAPVRAALDGAAKEELVFGVDAPEKHNSPEDFDYSQQALTRMRHEGKLVLVVEYLNDPRKIEEARRIVTELGFVLTLSPKNRELARLVHPPSNTQSGVATS